MRPLLVFHVIQLLTEGVPIFALQRSECGPLQCPPWNLCANGNLGSMESNVMALRALFGRFQLPDGLRPLCHLPSSRKSDARYQSSRETIERIDELPRSHLS